MANTDIEYRRHLFEAAAAPALDENQLAAALADAYRRRPKLSPAMPAAPLARDGDEVHTRVHLSAPLPTADVTADQEAPSTAEETPGPEDILGAEEPTERQSHIQWLQRARHRRLMSGLHHAAAWATAIIVGCVIAALVALLLFGLPDEVAARLPSLAKVPNFTSASTGTVAR